MTKRSDLICEICGSRWVVPSLARACEDKCLEGLEEE